MIKINMSNSIYEKLIFLSLGPTIIILLSPFFWV